MMPSEEVQTLQFDLTFTRIVKFRHIFKYNFKNLTLKCNGGRYAISNVTEIRMPRVEDSIDILI